jgi:hypothetical protein
MGSLATDLKFGIGALLWLCANDLVAFFNLDFSKWSLLACRKIASSHWVIWNATWLFQNQEAFGRELSLAVPPPSNNWEFVFALTIHNSLGEVAPLFARACNFMSSPDTNVNPTLIPPLAESAFAIVLKACIQAASRKHVGL